MNPLELRKIIQIGYRFDKPEAPPILDREGLPAEPVKEAFTATIAFWIPAPKPFQRCAGDTKVAGAYAHELQALQDGVIVEHVQDFTFPNGQPSMAEMRHRLLAVWEGLTAENLGVAFNNVPLDSSTRPIFQLTSITQENGTCLPPTV